MRIEDLNAGGLSKAQNKKSERVSASKNPAPSSQASGQPILDTVELSEGGHSQFSSIRASYGELGDVKAERLNALKEKIESGKYHPKSEEVAQAIIRYVQQY